MKAKQAVSQHPLLPLPAAELLLGLLSQVTEQISLPGVPKLSEDLFFLIYQGKKKSQAPESTPHQRQHPQIGYIVIWGLEKWKRGMWWLSLLLWRLHKKSHLRNLALLADLVRYY